MNVQPNRLISKIFYVLSLNGHIEYTDIDNDMDKACITDITNIDYINMNEIKIYYTSLKKSQCHPSKKTFQ